MSQKEDGKRPHRAPPPFPPPSCPRCSSGNTKFCYYNNYSVSQPRYICKNCRRYWTHGGVVRNIPCSRKRTRADSKPPATGMLVPQPSPAGSFMQEELTDFQRNTVGTLIPLGSHDNRVGGDVGSSVGCVTFQPPITQTIQSFGGSGGFFNQTAFEFIQGGVNTAFNGVNVAFGGGAPRLPPPFTPMFTRHSGLDGFGDFGSSFIQRPQFQPPPTMAVNSLSTTLTSANDSLPIARDPNAAAANVVSIKEWSELDDMESESDPLQSYKQSVP